MRGGGGQPECAKVTPRDGGWRKGGMNGRECGRDRLLPLYQRCILEGLVGFDREDNPSPGLKRNWTSQPLPFAFLFAKQHGSSHQLNQTCNSYHKHLGCLSS